MTRAQSLITETRRVVIQRRVVCDIVLIPTDQRNARRYAAQRVTQLRTFWRANYPALHGLRVSKHRMRDNIGERYWQIAVTHDADAQWPQS